VAHVRVLVTGVTTVTPGAEDHLNFVLLPVVVELDGRTVERSAIEANGRHAR
jgi:hypothetical protein